MLASLPVAPLKGAHKLVLSDVLAPRPLGSEGVGGGEGSRVDVPDSSSPAAKCGADTAPHSPYTTALRRQPSMMTAQPLMARSFRPASAPRWLLCGASGSPAVFALPWGRASDDDEAEATFPTAVELLNEPLLDAARVLDFYQRGAEAVRRHMGADVAVVINLYRAQSIFTHAWGSFDWNLPARRFPNVLYDFHVYTCFHYAAWMPL